MDLHPKKNKDIKIKDNNIRKKEERKTPPKKFFPPIRNPQYHRGP